jgi:lipopolysaccharide/colanic/teichoic acid biosynthesis glycosyltransferase
MDVFYSSAASAASSAASRPATRISGERRVSRTSAPFVSLSPAAAMAPQTAAPSATTDAEIVVLPRTRSELINRGLNLALAVVAIIVLLPVMLLVSLAVLLTSRGPILYTQERVGIDRRARRAVALYDRRQRDDGGSVFTIYKFRSMRVDAEQNSGPIWATPNDPRVTPIGQFLRKSRLDELPQLFNVVRGDMNIVGPRPERPSIFAKLRNDISGYRLRQRAKPGITGLAQINNAYDQTIDDVRSKVRYDLEYLGRQSVVEDVRIMLRTVPVMLFKRGGW